jgi:hypothetical protein
VELKLDALIVPTSSNGVSLEARIADPHAYAIAWAWGEAELRIDTAPLHRDLATFPNHLHSRRRQPAPRSAYPLPAPRRGKICSAVIVAILASTRCWTA